MTQRDLAWRGIGTALVIAATAIRIADGASAHAGAGVLAFLLVLIGFVLIIQGKRVPAAFRVELSRHRLLPGTLHDRRRRRSGRDA